MNSDRVKVLANIYMERYNDIISKENDSRDKWAAVSSCAKKWNVDAEDFAGMVGNALKKASYLIDEEQIQPMQGILYLCKKGRTQEVRQEFSRLLARDGGDIADRQSKVGSFVKAINAMLADEAPDKWQYRQKIRTAIRYLAIIRPEENYFFNAAQSAEFAGYIEADEEIGYDKFLKLQNYYRMCDDVAAYLQERTDLLDVVNRGLAEKGKKIGDPDIADIDPQLHILVYDLIDVSYRFQFYDEKAANRKSKISTVAQRKIDRTKKSAELLTQRESCVDRLDTVIAEQDKTKVPSLKGRRVEHQAFGSGKITDQEGKYLTVEFRDVTKKFALPGAVVKGFLKFDDSKYTDIFRTMEEIQARRRQYEDELTSIDVQLKLLEG